MTGYKLRDASDVRREMQAEREPSKEKTKDHDKIMAMLVEQIEKHKVDGFFSTLKMTPAIKAELEAAGYRVKRTYSTFFKRRFHEISWDRKG